MALAREFVLVVAVLGVGVSLLAHWAIRPYLVACCISVGTCLGLIAATIPFTHFPHGNNLTLLAFHELGSVLTLIVLPDLGTHATNLLLQGPHWLGLAVCLIGLIILAGVVGLPFRYLRNGRPQVD